MHIRTEYIRLTGASFDEAWHAEFAKLSAEEIESVKKGMEEIAFGGDTAALEAFYRQVEASLD